MIPGKTQLVSRRASQFAEGVSPIYASHAKGSRFTDVDGNEYIDWVNCVSAVILGHAEESIDNAVVIDDSYSALQRHIESSILKLEESSKQEKSKFRFF